MNIFKLKPNMNNKPCSMINVIAAGLYRDKNVRYFAHVLYQKNLAFLFRIGICTLVASDMDSGIQN